ncbi:MAG: hypothetical protein IJ179_04305 [Oscillospiraceae bacterium]|nr:hypothetical protein [Oscillospiraceae bacterium]
MKAFTRICISLLVLAMAAGLCACGGSSAPAPTAAPTQAPAMSAALPDAGLQKADTPTAEAGSEAEPAAQADEALKAAAAACIEKSVEDLYAAIGEPNGSSYAPSCLNPGSLGEDGELYYDGFTVYTYKESDSEIVKDVE